MCKLLILCCDGCCDCEGVMHTAIERESQIHEGWLQRCYGAVSVFGWMCM